MATKKKSRRIEIAQKNLVQIIDEVSQMTTGQRLKNYELIIHGFNEKSCELLAAIEAYFTPAPKTDPKTNDQ